MYRKPGCSPLFAMPRGINEMISRNDDGTELITPYYLSVEKSVDILSQLLDFQTKDKTQQFLKILVNILDKRVPKLNSLFVYGPPSGKKFSFDTVKLDVL